MTGLVGSEVGASDGFNGEDTLIVEGFLIGLIGGRTGAIGLGRFTATIEGSLSVTIGLRPIMLCSGLTSVNTPKASVDVTKTNNTVKSLFCCIKTNTVSPRITSSQDTAFISIYAV